MTSDASASIAGMPTGMSLPPGFTGPPARATGSSAGFSIPSSVTGIPTGVTGFPAGATGPPAGGPQGTTSQAQGMAYSPQQVRIMNGMDAMFLALCFIVVSARLLARTLARMRFGVDDWTCVTAFIFFLGMCIEQVLMSLYGKRLAASRPHSINEIKSLTILGLSTEVTYVLVTSLSKYCVLALYRRLFSLRTKWFRILWWICMAVVTCYLISTLVLETTTCTPASKHWTNPSECALPKHRLVASGFLNAAIDLAILVLPIRTVWKLRLSLRKRIAICGVFSLGLLAVAVSIARVCVIIKSMGNSAFVIWSNAEPAVAIICSCLPVLRPLYTDGLAKIGSRTPWSLCIFRRSKHDGSQEPPDGSRNTDHTDTDITGTTLQSDRRPENADEKKWYNATDAEIGAAGYNQRSATQSPVSLLDKPLPPAYTECEGDTAYHTWTWNLLSRPRDEHKSPTLTRQTIIKETGYPWREPTCTGNSSRNQMPGAASRGLISTTDPYPSRVETHISTLDRSARALPPTHPKFTGKTSASATPIPSSSSQPLSKKSSLSMRPSPLNSVRQPAHPKPVARNDRLEPGGISVPSPTARPQPRSLPSTQSTTVPDIISNTATRDVNPDPAASNPGNHTRPTTRPRRRSHVSELAMSPHASTKARPSLRHQRSHPATGPIAPTASAATHTPASSNPQALRVTDGNDSDIDRIYPAPSSSRDAGRAEARNESRSRDEERQKSPAPWSSSVTAPAPAVAVSSPPGSRIGGGGIPPRDIRRGRAPPLNQT